MEVVTQMFFKNYIYLNFSFICRSTAAGGVATAATAAAAATTAALDRDPASG